MRTAIIQNGTVVNVIETGEEWIPPEGVVSIASDAAGIGDLWDGVAFLRQRPRREVPARVSNYQWRAALIQAGLFAQIDGMMSDPTTDALVVSAWEYATDVSRESRIMAAIADGLSLSPEQLDDLFISAAAITS